VHDLDWLARQFEDKRAHGVTDESAIGLGARAMAAVLMDRTGAGET